MNSNRWAWASARVGNRIDPRIHLISTFRRAQKVSGCGIVVGLAGESERQGHVGVAGSERESDDV